MHSGGRPLKNGAVVFSFLEKTTAPFFVVVLLSGGAAAEK
jgi:hypothetical protein